MDTHKNAPLTPKGREAMVRAVVDFGLSRAAAARQFNTTPKTVAKWVGRFREEGVGGLRDRSSRPHSSPSQTVAATCTAVEALRRQRHTGKQIALDLKISPASTMLWDQAAAAASFAARAASCCDECDWPTGARDGRTGPSGVESLPLAPHPQTPKPEETYHLGWRS